MTLPVCCSYGLVSKMSRSATVIVNSQCNPHEVQKFLPPDVIELLLLLSNRLVDFNEEPVHVEMD